MKLSTGSRWQSAVGTTELVIVRAPEHDITLCCGGHPVLPSGDEKPNVAADPALVAPALLGKRYAHPDVDLEILITKAGDGTLTVDGVELELKGAKPLPSSD